MTVFFSASLHRLALRFAHAVRLAWWRLRRPDLRGCNAIVTNAAGDVLLVRHSYQSPRKWMLPGGGLKRGESPEAAAMRELREETGCTMIGAHCFGVETVPLSGARNHIHLVAGRTRDEPVADGREILAAAFFAPECLPVEVADATRNRVRRWAREVQKSES